MDIPTIITKLRAVGGALGEDDEQGALALHAANNLESLFNAAVELRAHTAGGPARFWRRAFWAMALLNVGQLVAYLLSAMGS